MKEAELNKRRKENYEIEIPFALEKDLDRFRQGKNVLHAVLKNRTGKGELRKVTEFML